MKEQKTTLTRTSISHIKDCIKIERNYPKLGEYLVMNNNEAKKLYNSSFYKKLPYYKKLEVGTLEENRELMKSFNENSKDNYSFKSKFTRGYLQTNREKGLGKGFTPSSFSTLLYSKGNKYQHNKITNDLKNNPESNFGFISARSRTAYYPIDMFDEEKAKKWKTIIAIHRLSPEISIKDLVKKTKIETEIE